VREPLIRLNKRQIRQSFAPDGERLSNAEPCAAQKHDNHPQDTVLGCGCQFCWPRFYLADDNDRVVVDYFSGAQLALFLQANHAGREDDAAGERPEIHNHEPDTTF
jgi:hypothetical protein